MNRISKLKGVVQHYSWGGSRFIPQLLGINNEDGKPFAEYWLGAHPNAPAFLEGENKNLQQLISESPDALLGKPVSEKFGSLPYLFKILDVRQMLSIQVHPSKAAAEEEFARENEKGISLMAPNRNYKDKNHKPELMVALSDFWLLHGFKQERELEAIFRSVPELGFLSSSFENGGYRGLYEEVMTMPQEKVDAALSSLMQQIIPLYQDNRLEKNNEHFWAARAALTFCKNNSFDRGIFSIYLFNLLYLEEGEAIFQPAGLPHAYLEGQNVEVMANSDNVLRAGLTDKHVDVPELMKHVKFEATVPAIIRAGQQQVQSFDAPVHEFQLKKYSINEPVLISSQTATILFVYEGSGEAEAGGCKLALKKGEAVLVPANQDVKVNPGAGPMTLFSVTTPMNKN